MLKKLTSALLCLCLLAGLGAIFVSAEISDRVLDESWNDLKLSVLLDITVDGANAYYNCDYYILYLVDQGTVSESEAVDAYLYAVGLTTKAAEEVVKMRTPTQDPSEITTDDGANETTDDVTKENDVTTVSDTKADTTDKVDCSDAVTTSATTKSDSTTTATSSSKSGCGSIVAASAIFVPVLMAGMMLRKKKDK